MVEIKLESYFVRNNGADLTSSYIGANSGLAEGGETVRRTRYLNPELGYDDPETGQTWFLFEMMSRIDGGRRLLRPGELLNARFAGVLGKVQAKVEFRLHGLTVMPNHYHALLSARSLHAVSELAEFLNGNSSKEIKRPDVYRYDAKHLWGDRVSIIQVAPDMLESRLKYQIGNSVKEGLVRRLKHYPGIHSFHQIVEGQPLIGEWVDRTAFGAAKKANDDVDIEPFIDRIEVKHAPPVGMAADTFRALFKRLSREVEREGADDKSRPILGPAAVRALPLYEMVSLSEPKGPPRVLAVEPEQLKAWDDGYEIYEDTRRGAAEDLESDLEALGFPRGCRVPTLPRSACKPYDAWGPTPPAAPSPG